jgi:hypothetical protein
METLHDDVQYKIINLIDKHNLMFSLTSKYNYNLVKQYIVDTLGNPFTMYKTITKLKAQNSQYSNIIFCEFDRIPGYTLSLCKLCLNYCTINNYNCEKHKIIHCHGCFYKYKCNFMILEE